MKGWYGSDVGLLGYKALLVLLACFPLLIVDVCTCDVHHLNVASHVRDPIRTTMMHFLTCTLRYQSLVQWLVCW